MRQQFGRQSIYAALLRTICGASLPPPPPQIPLPPALPQELLDLKTDAWSYPIEGDVALHSLSAYPNTHL